MLLHSFKPNTALSLSLLMDDEHNNYGPVDRLLLEGGVHLNVSQKKINLLVSNQNYYR